MSSVGRSRAYVALGANLGRPVDALRMALGSLGKLPDTVVVAQSGIYRTAPVGVDGQPDYYNAVAAIDTGLTPQQLLTQLLATEAAHGRTRPAYHASRTLDLDLLLYEARQIDEPGLTVPHPRMHLRAFVLQPLHEIAPSLSIPGHGPVSGLLGGVADQRIDRLAD